MLEEIRLTDGSGTLVVAAVSDIGNVRKNNEDSFGVFPGERSDRGHLLLVADGMGGAAGGEVASRLAVERVHAGYQGGSGGSAPVALEAAVEDANAAIFRKSGEDPNLGGMGTTCTAVAVVGREIWFGHVGDSRAYLASGGELRQITRDHSLAAEFERQGGGGGAAARVKNVLTRCLGVKPEVKVDVPEGPIAFPEDGCLVLCSDGLTNLVEDGEILHMASMHLPDSAAKRLVQLAKERGAPDNVTVIVARISA
jgi:protein phosphatase